MDYATLIQHFGSPLKAAIALGFARDNSPLRIKRNAGARVSMWAHNGIPEKQQKRIAKVLTKEATPPPLP